MKNSKSLLIKDSLTITIAQGISAVFGFISMLFYTKLLTSEEYGLYSLLFSSSSLIVSLLTGWLSSSVLRFTLKYKSELTGFVSTIIRSLFFIQIIVITVSVILQFFYNGIYIIYVALLFVSFSTYQVLISYIRALGSTRLFSLVASILPFLRLSLVYLGHLFIRDSINLIFIGIFVADTIINMILIYKSNIFNYFIWKGYSYKHVKVFIKYGMPLVATSGMLWILSYSDRYIITYFWGMSATGLYSIGYDLVGKSVGIVLVSVATASFPLMLKVWNEKPESAAEVISTALYYYLLLSIPIASVFSIFKKEIFVLLFDAEYLLGYVCLPWVAGGTILLGVAHNYVNRIWQLKEKTHVNVLLIIMTAIINVLLNIIFVPVTGFYAASITTFASCLIYAISSVIVSSKHLSIKFTRKQIESFFVCVIYVVGFSFISVVAKIDIYGIKLLVSILTFMIGYAFVLLISNTELRHIVINILKTKVEIKKEL